jgi:hypothetical protein
VSVKLEIINISLDFVADFWNFRKEKTGEGIVGEEMFKFSTVEVDRRDVSECD